MGLLVNKTFSPTIHTFQTIKLAPQPLYILLGENFLKYGGRMVMIQTFVGKPPAATIWDWILAS